MSPHYLAKSKSHFRPQIVLVIRNQKLTRVSLIYRTEATTKKWKTEKLKSKKIMLRTIGKQSTESVELVPKKKRKATVGRICKKRKVLVCHCVGAYQSTNFYRGAVFTKKCGTR